MPFIVDASLVAAWFLPDESSQATERLLDALLQGEGFAPDLLWHEVRNFLVTGFRRERLSAPQMLIALDQMMNLPIRNCGGGDGRQIMALAMKHQLSAYDACYLALAQVRDLPLATLDGRLQEAAVAEGVEVLAT